MQFAPTCSRSRFSSIRASAARLALPIACLAALALAPSTAIAGGYSGPTYSGGTWYGHGPGGVLANWDDSAIGSGWGGTSAAVQNADCGETITSTFTWTHATGMTDETDPPPQSVIVVESSKATGGGTCIPAAAVSGACDDGIGQTQSPLIQTPLMSGTYQYGTYGTGDCHGTRYRVVSGAAPLQLTCTPTSSASSSATINSVASVTYSAADYPVTIDLTGTTLDSSGNVDVLTGQQVKASVNWNGLPSGFTVASYTWSVGGNAFKDYDPTLSSGQLVPLSSSDKTGPTPPSTGVANLLFYDKTQETLTVTLAATLTAPDGTTLNVTAKSVQINVEKPSASWAVDPTTLTINGTIINNVIGFHDDSGTKQSFGVNTTWYPATISVPAPFTGGQGCFAQLVTPSALITRIPTGSGASTYYLKIQNAQGDWIAPGIGLDGSFPYLFGFTTDGSGNITGIAGDSSWQAGGTGASGDNPTGQESTTDVDSGGTDWTSSSISDSFSTWLMYRPPANGAMATVWIPVKKATWSATGNASGGPSNWSATGTYSPPVPADATDFPLWNTVIKGQQYRP